MSINMSWEEYYNKYFYVRNITTREQVGAQNEYTDCQFVAKIHEKASNGTMKYVDSAIIPTDYYPLNDATFRVFHHGNCKEITDTDTVLCFDSIKMRCGFCYAMADELHTALDRKNIANSIWCGWLFAFGTIPVHHCWVTIGENSESVLDVQEDFEGQEQKIRSILKEEQLSYDNAQKIVVNNVVTAMRGKIKNSERCSTKYSPLGVPSPSAFYVGTKISNGEAARHIYNDLIAKYPHHAITRNLGTDNRNSTQRKIYESF